MIARAILASFTTELSSVQENVDMKYAEHAMTLLLEDDVSDSAFVSYNSGKQKLFNAIGITELPTTLDEEMNRFGTSSDNLWIVDKKTGNGKENTYLYDDKNKIVYKIQGLEIYGTTIHSINGKNIVKPDSKDNKDDPEEGEVATNLETKYTSGYYEPDVNGFDINRTFVVYFDESKTLQNSQRLLLADFIKEGKPKKREFNGKEYTFYEYIENVNNSIWGNVVTQANGLEAWWVWIPRYSYDIANITKTPTDGQGQIKVRFITTNNKLIENVAGEFKETTSIDGTTYISHPAFDPDENTNLKGIWMSKYEPSETTRQPSDNDLMVETNCYVPDMKGFDTARTYLVKYDKTGTSIVSQDLLKDVGTSAAELRAYNESTDDAYWYNYERKLWGNVKTVANGMEAWWVWIPRYAYSISANKDVSIIFVDINGKPFDTEAYPNGLPDGYVVHPAFTEINEDESKKELKGIWMSKYEPSETNKQPSDNDLIVETNCYMPDISGFDTSKTYLIKYDKTGTSVVSQDLLKDVGTSEQQLKEYNTSTNNAYWYNYERKLWGNVKTVGNGLEAWWVWIPRYAYSISATKDVSIIFVDLNGEPFDKHAYPNGLPDGYIVHPAFTEINEDNSKKELKGIWMSKYEPSGEPTDLEKLMSE